MKTKNTTKNKKVISTDRHGFTLIELIIVVAIIGIMTSVGLVSLNKSLRVKKLEAEVIKVQGVIREGQNNALSGKKANECSGGWKFSFDNKDFKLEGVGVGCVASYTYELSGDAYFTAPDSIIFSFPMGFVSKSLSPQLKNSSGDCYQIDLNQAGMINIEGC